MNRHRARLALLALLFRVRRRDALALATRLQALGKTYQLVIRSGSDHHLSGWLAERDAQAVEWFRRHMKK